MTRSSIDRRLPLVAIVFVLSLGLGGLMRAGMSRRSPTPVARTARARLPSLDTAGTWVIGRSSDDSLRGHVAMVVLWSDTDPRSLEALPEAQAWSLAYGRYGLRVVGVHVPEFSFAVDTQIVARVAHRLGLTFPIVSDASYRLSARFHRPLERPAFYIGDAGGHLVYERSGMDAFEVDHALRTTLAGARPHDAIPMEPATIAASPRPSAPAAERISYLGVSRADQGPLARAQPGREQPFTAQFRFQEEGSMYVPYPVGRWTPEAEGLKAARGGAEHYVSIRVTGRVWVVITPPPSGPARVWILGDDAWLDRRRAGDDVRYDARGAAFVNVAEPRLYSIAQCPEGAVLKLSPESAGTTFYAFAFEPIPAP